MNKQEHWENIYATRQVTEVSWFREHLQPSLDLIESAEMPRDAAIIDIGGGASTLADDLVADGYTNVTVLDISANALDKVKDRLQDQAPQVQ
jgi:ubiquinone/menaquinone biosynthesis C-methylase UbiE